MKRKSSMGPLHPAQAARERLHNTHCPRPIFSYRVF